MSDVDTSREAVETIAVRLKGMIDWRPGSLCERAAATLRALLAEVDDLRAHKEALADGVDDAQAERDAALARATAAEADRDRLREALDFYACVDHYPIHNSVAPAVVRDDGGKRARAALARKEPTP